MASYTKVEYKCSYCGAVTTRAAYAGRPTPGNCIKKGRDKKGLFTKPHSWVINRKY